MRLSSGSLKFVACFFKELAEQHDLSGEFLRADVIRKKIEHLVTKDRGATGLEHNHRNAFADFSLKRGESLEK